MSEDKGYRTHKIQGWLRKVEPVVDKSGPVCPNTIFLPKEKPSTFGRSGSGVTTQLVSRKTPLMISRKHATIEFKDGQWMITDHESLNGVFVNGIKIKPSDAYPLLCGDKVAFGIAFGNSKTPEFEYIFQEVPQDYKLKRSRQNSEDDDIHPKRQREGDTWSANSHTDSDTQSAFEEQIQVQEDKIKELTSELLSKEQAHQNLALTLEKREQDLEEKLEKQRNKLESEKLEAEKKLQELLENQLKEKESMLKEKFEEKLRSLETERDVVEKKLQKELNDKLTEKDETYKEELEKQREALNRILNEMQMEKKNREFEISKNQKLLDNLKSAEENEKQLGNCLEELRRQIQEKDQYLLKQEEITRKAEEDGKRLVLQQMEDEFTCMICHELFVHAVTLSCAHSFCEMCLRSWMKKKKECPVCRGKITGRAVKSVVLDSAINKMIENADNETRLSRERLVIQRNALREAEKAKGFDKLLVTDVDPQPLRGVDNQGNVRVWNSRPNNQEGQRYSEFVPGAHTHEVFSNRYPHVSTSAYAYNSARQRGYGSSGRSSADDPRGNTNRNAQRVDQNHIRGHGRDGRQPSNDGRRYGGPPPQQSRVWNGNCYLCGNRGHYARNCYLSSR